MDYSDKAYTKESVKWAYCILHQKLQVYLHSNIPSQKDDIEDLVGDYAGRINPVLYKEIAQGKESFLMEHDSFASDLQAAVERFEKLL